MSIEPIVRVRDLHKSFTRGSETIEVLKDLTLDVAEGRVSRARWGRPAPARRRCSTSSPGSISRPPANIRVGDGTSSAMSESQLARWRTRHVGFVFQFYHLLPVLTAYENVELPLLLLPLSAAERQASRC